MRMLQNNKAFHNAKWIIGCKIVQAVMQLIIGMITARYLGPSDYGLINYAASVVAFFTPFMQLGLQYTLVQAYIQNPDNNGEIMGTSMAMTLFSGLVSMLAVISFSLIANWGEKETIIVCALYSITLLCQSMELLQYWFQSKLLSQFSSSAFLVAYIVVFTYKLFLLVTRKSFYWFALSYAIEYGISGLIMFVCHRKLSAQKLRFSLSTAMCLFSRSKYYIIAAMMGTVFHNTDHVMLKLISGNVENGFYTTAFTCTSIANFLYYGIADAFRPVILESQKESEQSFEEKITQLYSVIIWLSIAQSVLSTILAKPIVVLLFGNEYLSAIPVFKLLVWQLMAANAGIVRNIWILGTEQHSILWKINLNGVVSNIILNAIMIPAWGACGAAAASVLTQFVTNCVVGFILPPLRRNNYLMLKGLDIRWIKNALSDYISKKHNKV